MVKKTINNVAVEAYKAPACEEFALPVESAVLATSEDGHEKLNPVDGGQGGLG